MGSQSSSSSLRAPDSSQLESPVFTVNPLKGGGIATDHSVPARATDGSTYQRVFEVDCGLTGVARSISKRLRPRAHHSGQALHRDSPSSTRLLARDPERPTPHFWPVGWDWRRERINWEC